MLGKALKRRLKKWRPVLILLTLVALGVATMFFLPDEEAPKPIPQIASTPIPIASPTSGSNDGNAIDKPPPFFDEDDDREVDKVVRDPYASPEEEEKEEKNPE
ncbi:MAG: hypothetical protein HY074_00875 [Deltaproteobacteria bacterium]|nr:hypothetical protein [Deltaproteobacteria bacterium]